MAEEIQKLDLADAAEKLRDQIKTAFVAMIPPEQWQGMVKAELDKFCKPHMQTNSYGPDTRVPSGLERVVQEEAENKIREIVQTQLQTEAWHTWGVDEAGNNEIVSDVIKSWLTENSDQLMAAVLKAMMGNAAQQVLENLQMQR